MTALPQVRTVRRDTSVPEEAVPDEAVAPVVDIVVPVRDEERVLSSSVRRLAAYLRDSFPYRARITIAENGSSDGTWEIARSLAAELERVQAIRLDRPGRGGALKAAWLASDAEILAYMDVDLSTGLSALPPLVAPLLSGHSDLAIGTRLARGARVTRGLKRAVISHGYNLLLRATLGARFSDAQCGFKAIRADRAARLLPLVQDTGWFFDTELLVLAQRDGLRIHEVPVDWTDDPDSRVNILATVLADMRGIARVRSEWGSRKIRSMPAEVIVPPEDTVPPVLLDAVLDAVLLNAVPLENTQETVS
ncbi:MAG TPA: dolichyl-phosphate beta-glucosyltransferase [Trebonia sp.]